MTQERTREPDYFRSVVLSSPDYIRILDLDGRIEFVNPAGLKALTPMGLGVIGLYWPEVWSGEAERRQATDALEAARRGEKRGLASALGPSRRSVFRERIAQRGLVIHEETKRFGFQFVQVEARSEADLHGQIGMLRVRRGAQRLGFRVEPFLDAAFGAEPRRMVVRVIGRKARDGGDAQYPGGFVGRAAMKVMLGQAAHQTIAPEQQRQRLDHGGLAAIVWPHQYGMAAQCDVCRTHASEAGDFQANDMHFAISR